MFGRLISRVSLFFGEALVIHRSIVTNPRPVLHENTVYCPTDGRALFFDEGKLTQVSSVQFGHLEI